MSANLVSDRPASISLLRILAMVAFGYIVMGNVIALLVVSLLYQGNLVEALSNPVAHPDIRNIMLLAQGLASLVGLILIPWFYLKTFENRSPTQFIFQFPAVGWFGILTATVVALAIALSPIAEWNAGMEFPAWMGGLGDFFTQMERQAEIMVKAFTSNLTPITFTFVFVVIAVIPALGEELVFRGLIQTELQRAVGNPHVGIWLAAAFFSAFHFQFFGFFPRLLIGVVLGYLYFWSGNLWISIVLHFLNNGLQVIALYLRQLEVINFDVESTESAPLYFVFPAIVMLAALLYYCQKNLATSSNQIHS